MSHLVVFGYENWDFLDEPERWALVRTLAHSWHRQHDPRPHPQRQDKVLARGIALTEAGREHQRQMRESQP